MSDKPLTIGVEPAYYPGTNTLVNLLEIKDSRCLSQKEADFTFVRSLELLQSPPRSVLNNDYASLRAIHKYLFQDLYQWAGRPRNFDFRKGGDQFMPATELEDKSVVIFAGVSNLGQNLNQLPQHLADLLSKINFFHPFPEGNGRAQRIFLSLLVKQHGFDLN
ncbi:MAG: Fic family protein, partial [Cellvibrionaceae bacterium]|nr:Fic family protein [Cellvibrionaceae bacterium]